MKNKITKLYALFIILAVVGSSLNGIAIAANNPVNLMDDAPDGMGNVTLPFVTVAIPSIASESSNKVVTTDVSSASRATNSTNKTITVSSDPTCVSGMISFDTTWTLANSPYIVVGGVLVNDGVTLTIEPGVTVKFDSGFALQIDGTLIAQGTSDNMITFTSNQTTPVAGDWGYVLFSDSSTDYDDGQGSILEYCVVEYAGGVSVDNNGAVRMNNAHPFINYCTIRNNNAAGIYAWSLSENLKITNNTIINNIALSSGGGIGVTGGIATISNNTISNNKASYHGYGGGGGGISVCGCTAIIYDNTISDNTALGGSYYYYGGSDGGGGIYVFSGATATILNNTINNNTASLGGGGIYVYSATAIISNNFISQNTANAPYGSGNSGGGIGIHSATATVSNNNIRNNIVSGDGGGISVYGGTTTILNNTISNNQLSSGGFSYGGGGGIIVFGSATATISNNLVSENNALHSKYDGKPQVGGGIYVYYGIATISNNSIIRNAALNASAVYYSYADNQDFKYNTIIGNIAMGTAPTYAVFISSHPLFNKNNIFDNTATYELYNGNPQGSPNLNATNNWWGTTDETEIQAMIYDWFDDSSKGIVDYNPYLYAPVGFADNLWNIRYNADDRFHDNEPWLRPWRHDYEDGWGRWVGEWSYEVPWSQNYTQSSGSVGNLNWDTLGNGNLHISASKDHQWHAWTYVYVSSPKNITIPASGDCVPRCFLNYAFDSPHTFPATLHLETGWNRIDLTGYNQNSGYSFDLNYNLTTNVDIMSSSQRDSPFIIGTIPPAYTDEDTPYSCDLTSHEFDLKDNDTDLIWSISGVDISLFNVSISLESDVLTIMPVCNAYGSDTVTLTLTDSDGLSASQDITVTIFSVNDPPIASFTYSSENLITNQTITFNASNSIDPDGCITNYEWGFDDGNITSTTESVITHSYTSAGDYYVGLTVTDNDGATSTTLKIIAVSEIGEFIFDTGEGSYPSILGIHNGTITPNQTITVSKIYTYPCTGTGGHAEYVKIWNSTWNTTATWNGYAGDYHNLTFSESFVLRAGETYHYTIRTGSYPQIIHATSKAVTGGIITCTQFTDVNGVTHNDWIPAIRLE
ncbi:MAG: PKD domain-containing protein [Methanocellales archaeon]|nr:PKD domain-containing protein [Methanocellales archaeon]MDD3292298.1 PKD domain-containing protein [Methanocellales archaeon]MDD5235592.1 PKD domain-containing protein [Methanocellales archaeon]MDD5485761.1 PKD domain-containing protein [Methanocellales archaeon]